MSELIIIDKGDEVESDTLNFNFQCLDEKVVSTNQRIETVSASIKSVQSTLNSQLTETTDNLNQSIEEFNSEINAKLDTKLNIDDKVTIIDYCVPDYTKGQSIGNTFTAPKNGVVYLAVCANESFGSNITINNVVVNMHWDYEGEGGLLTVPHTFIVAKGDVLKVSQTIRFGKFFPMKGAV